MKGRRPLAGFVALACAVTAATFAAPPALAHPLGNFTINQLAQVRIAPGEARIHYVLDQAEIPTFQQLQRYDAEPDSSIFEGVSRVEIG